MTTEQKRSKEQRVVSQMIAIYCKGKHGHRVSLCEECAALQKYVDQRIEHCPFMETKTFCSACKVHCYKVQMREKIRAVMRYAGPRMLFYHPILTICHGIETIKHKKGAT